LSYTKKESAPCHCEEDELPDEAIFHLDDEIALGKEQERPRNDIK
jgi:hypothetical protein